MTRHVPTDSGRPGPAVLTQRMALGTMSPPRLGLMEKIAVVRALRRADHGRQVRSAAAVVAGLLLLFTGCATSSSDPPSAEEADSDNDPAEGVNRAIFKANLAADHAVMRPVAQAYTDHVPEVVQTSVHNVVQNLKEPAVALNDLLQGNVNHAWQSVQRLAVNTTVGAGIVDVAAKWGLPPHKADFGQTLAVWGVGEGPFVELPLLGPSNPRDALGTAVDLALNPLTFVGGAPATYAGVATGGANLVDVRAQHLHDLDELERNSLDYYAALRSVYRQHREAEITAAKQPEAEGRVDISFPNTSSPEPPGDSGK
jgi:phospholipid-binding lipoprotein MlaA